MNMFVNPTDVVSFSLGCKIMDGLPHEMVQHCCQSLFQTWSEVVNGKSLVDPDPVVELLANISTLQPEKRWQRYRTQVSDNCLSNFFFWSL